MQFRTTELTDAQMALEEEYLAAVKALHEMEFEAEYVKLFCSKPTDQPGCLYIRGHGIR